MRNFPILNSIEIGSLISGAGLRSLVKKQGIISIRVFHGTDSDFTDFDSHFLGSANGTAPINKTGFNFTTSELVARSFGNRIIEANISIERPFIMDAKNASYGQFKDKLNEKLNKLDCSIHDAVVILNYSDAGIYLDSNITSTHIIPLSTNAIQVIRCLDATNNKEDSTKNRSRPKI